MNNEQGRGAIQCVRLARARRTPLRRVRWRTEFEPVADSSEPPLPRIRLPTLWRGEPRERVVDRIPDRYARVRTRQSSARVASPLL